MNKESKRLVAIFLIALGLRMIPFLAAGFWREEVYENRIVHFDSTTYKILALNLVRNRVFSRSEFPPYHPETFMTPIYPSFLASVIIISGNKPYIAILIQLIIGSATCIILYKIGKILFDERTAFLAGLFASFDYSFIFYNNVLITETLFVFLFSVHIFFLVKFLMSDNLKCLSYSSLFLGLSTLTRPISIYFFAFLVLIFFVHFKRNLSHGILRYLIFTMTFLVVLAPWIARNYKVSGKFLVSSAQEEVMAWNSIDFRGIFQNSDAPSLNKDSDKGFDLSKVEPRKSKINISFRLVKRYLNRIVRFFMIPSSSSYPKLLGISYREVEVEDMEKTPWESLKMAIQKKTVLERSIFFVCMSFLIFLYLTMSIGIYRAIRNSKVEAILLTFIIIIYFTLPSLTISWTQRYRVPIMPYVILLSSYGIVYLYKNLMNHKMKNREIINDEKNKHCNTLL